MNVKAKRREITNGKLPSRVCPVCKKQVYHFWFEEDGPDEDEYEPKLAEREGEEHES